MCRKVGRASRRGFTLLELMVAVVIIGVLAALAMPTMIEGRREQRAYDDASSILELMRNARTRAIGRGTATLLTLDATNSRGTFRLSEGTAPSPEIPGILKAPRPSCMSTNPGAWILNSPVQGAVDWTLPNQWIDGFDLDGNGEMEQGANIWSRIISYGLAIPGQNGAPPCAGTCFPQRVDVCFTSAGRPFVSLNANPPIFNTSAPFIGLIEVDVARLFTGQTVVTKVAAKGPIRQVFLPPSGIARLSSVLP